jgi:hypothetical protein
MRLNYAAISQAQDATASVVGVSWLGLAWLARETQVPVKYSLTACQHPWLPAGGHPIATALALAMGNFGCMWVHACYFCYFMTAFPTDLAGLSHPIPS